MGDRRIHDHKAITVVIEDDSADRALLRKIDRRILPQVFCLYVISTLNRNNIGNAKIEGLVSDMSMTDQQYIWTASAFYIMYALFQTPSNIVLRKIRPSIWFPALMIAWGSCVISMAFVKEFETLLLCRLLMGVAQAGYFPGMSYYLSCWYRRSEYGLRAAIIISGSILSGAFGGLLAAAIAKMNGIGGLAGWSWIFIIEGALAVVTGLAYFFLLIDFPETATCLTSEERERTIARIQRSPHSEEKTFTLQRFLDAIRDPKTLLGMTLCMGIDGPLYNFPIFLPSIIRKLDSYSARQAQLLSAPPYVVACICTVVAGWVSDRTGKRALCNILGLTVTIAGYVINIVPGTGPEVRYAGVYLVAAGLYPCISNTMAWISNNVEGSSKRSMVIAVLTSWGALHGFVTPHAYRARDSPDFTLGHIVMLVYTGAAMMSTILLACYLNAENKKRERGESDYRVRSGSNEEAADLGDLHPSFRYTF